MYYINVVWLSGVVDHRCVIHRELFPPPRLITPFLCYSWVVADRSVTDYEFLVNLRLADEVKHLGKYNGR